MPNETAVSAAAKTDVAQVDLAESDIAVPVAVSAQPSAEAQSREERAVMLRRGLRRMRTVATLLLVLMTAIFIATSMAKVDWVWLPYLRAFAERLLAKGAAGVMIDPDSSNHRARRAYARAGFVELGEVETASGPAMLMTFGP